MAIGPLAVGRIVADLLTTDIDRQIFATVAAAIFTGILAWVARDRLGPGYRTPQLSHDPQEHDRAAGQP